MLFHMYLTPVTKILIPVTKKQTLHIKQRTLKPLACTATQSQTRTIYTATKNLYNETTEQQTNQRTLKPLAYTATHSHKHVQYTQQQNKSATNKRTNTYIHIIHTYIHKIIKHKKVPAETLASAGTPLSWRPPTLPLSQYHRRKRA